MQQLTERPPSGRRAADWPDEPELHVALDTALERGDLRAVERCRDLAGRDERDELLALSALHDLWTAPLDGLGARAWLQSEPATVGVKVRLDRALLDRVQGRCRTARRDLPDGVDGMRRVAALDLVPEVYRRLGHAASMDDLVAFLAVEGGPDAGFDDLVALAQVGIRGDAKVALAENYWDEMGRGDGRQVHTRLHDELVAAVHMPRLPRSSLPVAALERAALGGVLVTNRHLQPEAIGALGLLEMQAGPRCRAVVRALRRLDAPEAALRFYEEHAVADPRHGKEWLDRVVAPLSSDPAWARRMVDGALWRHEVNRRFFADQAGRSGAGRRAAA